MRMFEWAYIQRYAFHEWRPFMAVLLLSACGVAVEALSPWPLKLIIDHVLAHRALPLNAAWIVHLPGGANPQVLLVWLSLGVVLLFLLSRAVALAKSVVEAGIAGRMKYRIAAELFGRLQELGIRITTAPTEATSFTAFSSTPDGCRTSWSAV